MFVVTCRSVNQVFRMQLLQYPVQLLQDFLMGVLAELPLLVVQDVNLTFHYTLRNSQTKFTRQRFFAKV